MKLTRRQLVAVAAGSAVAVQVRAQSGSAAGADASDSARAARDAVQKNADTLAKFEIPISTEPAFQFKA